MLKLNARDEKRRAEIVSALEDAKGACDEAWARVDEAIGEYNAAVAKFNEQMTEAEAWRSDMEAAMAEYEGERSDKWRDGESGEAYVEWHSQYEQVDFASEVEDLTVDDPTTALDDQIEALRDLPSAPGE